MLFPSWQGGWPSRAPDLYEPVGALFEQSGLGLYRPRVLETFFETTATLGLSLFFLCKNLRDGGGEMPAIPVGYVVRVTGRALRLRMSENREKNECLWSGVLMKMAVFWNNIVRQRRLESLLHRGHPEKWVHLTLYSTTLEFPCNHSC